MVDDASNDRTPELLHHYTDQDQCFKWSTLKEVADFNGSYKKRALTYGISQAKYEIIVTTDADCQFHTDWTTILANNIQEHHLVMATGPVLYQSTGWIEALLNIELASLVAIGAASLEKGYPNMCNGANLAFTKKGFYQVNGYKGYEQIVSGDDDVEGQAGGKFHGFHKNTGSSGGTGKLCRTGSLERSRYARGWKWKPDIR